jgi:predicted CXXCH cytochrome family protein
MPAPSQLTVLRFGLLAVVLVGAVVAGWYVFLHQEPREDSIVAPPTDDVPPDPRLAFATPFRNVKPIVQYVGDAACAGCHEDIDKKYHAHPMGRSAEFVAKATPIERYDAAGHNPTAVGPYELFVEKAGDKVRHHVRAKDADGRPLPDYVTTADIAIGSGTRGRSYLSFEQGSVWQSPISWYSPNARWDKSPGFDLGTGGRRAIIADCLFCHVNQVDAIPGSGNRYREPFPSGQAAIGCERCHGPGELHVAERTAGPLREKIDTSIVNPKHLSADLRAAVCAQCHLQGEQRVARRGRDLNEFRPGLPLELFVSVFVRHPDLAESHRSVGQFEQMHLSRCFTESSGRLGCTSCHDPHSTPTAATRDRHYNDRCQGCHISDSRQCSEQKAARQAKADNCVGCHMPRAASANIVHASVTDHRIMRRPSPSAPRGLTPGSVPLVPFAVSSLGPPTAEQERDLGVALSLKLSRLAADPSTGTSVAVLAVNRLEPTVAVWPADVPAWIALSRLRGYRGDQAGRLAAAAAAARLAPDSVVALEDLAEAAAADGQFDRAIEAVTALIGLAPRAVEPLLLRASFFIRQRDWTKAEQDCRAALAIHPLLPQGRLYFAICRYHRGDTVGGRREADTAIGLCTDPRQQTAFREWYQQQTR